MSFLLQYIDAAPQTCGVYIMKDAAGAVIYVGKAKNIRKRLASYFDNRDNRHHVGFLRRRIASIEYILTSNEMEALLLENNLIKKYAPRYNIQLKDDKSYPCIMIDTGHPFPRIDVVRRPRNPDALYFGPYPSAGAIRDVVATLQKIFPLRRCSDRSFGKRQKPCLYFDLGQCMAPCVDASLKTAYRRVLDDAVAFLRGRGGRVLKTLEQCMWAAAEKKEYERAAFIRDVIAARKDLAGGQGIEAHHPVNRDIIGTFDTGRRTNIALLFVREGKLIHRTTFSVSPGLSCEDTLSQFISGYYGKGVAAPDEIIVETPLSDATELGAMLSERFGTPLRVTTAKDREAEQLVKIARLNASSFTGTPPDAAAALRSLFSIDKTPGRIECFDVAHLSGLEATCAMTVCTDGRFSKSEYRLFNFAAESADDYAMLGEALRRRFRHTEWPFPDLLVVDGGRGQLAVASAVLDECGVGSVFPVAMTKGTPPPFFLRNRKNPLIPRRGDEGAKLLEKLRQEAHRFANMQLRRRLKSRMKPAGQAGRPNKK